jgi:aromatic-amino-acid transaminase
MSFLIPSRTSRPSDDPIFALNAEARARARAGEVIVNATVGALLDDEGRLAVLGCVAETLREVPPEQSAAYPPIAGPPEFLRAVIADILGDRPEASWATAVATPGGSGALRHALINFLEPGQSVLTASYYWGPYKTLADEGDRGLDTFRFFNEQGRLDLVDFERALGASLDAQGRALVFLNSPCNNPTGYSFDDEEWRSLVAILGRAAERGPITVLLDMAYARYAATDLGPTVDRLLELAGKVMILFAWSASKSFTEYGLRVGALVTVHPDDAVRSSVQNALTFACRGTWSTCNAGGMAAITRLLVEPDLRARVERERGALKALLDRRVARWNQLAVPAGLRYPRYDGGFFSTVFCESGPKTALRLKDEGIFVVPQGPSAIRVALCSVAERDIPRLVSGIARHVA